MRICSASAYHNGSAISYRAIAVYHGPYQQPKEGLQDREAKEGCDAVAGSAAYALSKKDEAMNTDDDWMEFTTKVTDYWEGYQEWLEYIESTEEYQQALEEEALAHEPV